MSVGSIVGGGSSVLTGSGDAGETDNEVQPLNAIIADSSIGQTANVRMFKSFL